MRYFAITPKKGYGRYIRPFLTVEGMSEDIMGGGIGIRPYRKEDDSTSCDYCPYHAVCRFDPRLGQEYRNLKELTDDEVYTNLRSRYPEKE